MAWWRAALAGKRPPIHDSTPQPGFYKRCIVRHGPMVPARIWLVQVVDEETGELMADEVFACEVGGKPRSAAEQWSYLAANPITEADFNHMTARARWAAQHADDHPIANPTRAVDWTASRIPF
jgi:hypothetical protein